MRPKLKKVMLAISAVLGSCIIMYALFITYLMTDGFKDYISYCSKYIDQINDYKIRVNSYPQLLDIFVKPDLSFRYDPEECGYEADVEGYYFSVPHGFTGTGFYSSVTNEWSYD